MPAYFVDHFQKTAHRPDYDLLEWLHETRIGAYQDQVNKVRTAKDKEEKSKHKMALPCIMPAAIGKGKKVEDVSEHSGYMVLDVDNLNAQELAINRDLIERDPYTFACYISAGGYGLCAFVRIPKSKPEEHTQRFLALEEYYLNQYGIVLDHSGSNINRLRAASHDPSLYLNEGAQLWRGKMPAPKKQPPKELVWGNSDIERVLGELISRGVNITSTYEDWLTVGLALHSWDSGQQGLDAYHRLSAADTRYSQRVVEQKWKSFKNKGGRIVTIASLLHMAKQFGIELVSRNNQSVASIAKSAKRSGANREAAKQRIEALGFTDVDGIADKVFELPDDRTAVDLPLNDQVQLYLTSKYDFKYNEVTNRLEVDGQPISDRRRNGIVLECQANVSDKVNANQVNTILDSDWVPGYHPIRDFIASVESIELEDELPNTWRYVRCFAHDSNLTFACKFFAKWAIGMIATAMEPDGYNELMPVLIGTIGDGKTRILREMLPPALRTYWAETFLDAKAKEGDSLRRTAENLVIFYDDISNDRKNAAALKAILSSRHQSIRIPYAKDQIKVARLASMVATSNEMGVIADITGNRRIVPIDTKPIDWHLFATIDIGQMFAEWVTAYRLGWPHWLTKEEVTELNNATQKNQRERVEEELLLMYAPLVEPATANYYTFTEICKHLSARAPLGYRFSTGVLQQALTKNGYKMQAKRHPRTRLEMYPCQLVDNPEAMGIAPKDAPF